MDSRYLDEPQVELVLLFPSVQFGVLDLLSCAKVAHAVVANGEVFVLIAVGVADHSEKRIEEVR